MVWREQSRPLPVDLWLRELGRLSVWCEHEASQADERAVRRAYHLAMLAPLGIRRMSLPAIPLAELDVLLDSGAIEKAARLAIGANARIGLVRLPDGDRWIADFSIGGDGPVSCEASTAATAIIRAWATFFTKAAG